MSRTSPARSRPLLTTVALVVNAGGSLLLTPTNTAPSTAGVPASRAG
jgi:hypothetical protein